MVPMLIARELRDEPLPISLLDLPPADLGVAGAKLAVADNNTTGRFMNQQFTLEEVDEHDPAKLVEDIIKKVDAGAHFILADMAPATLLKLADAVHGKDALIINYGAPDDRLREEDCRPNVLHSAPSRSMLADALAQYLVWKKWNRWLLVLGPRDEDKLFADAIRRSAKRFGGKIVEERPFVYETGASRRSDGGYRADPTADPDLHAERAPVRRSHRRRRRQYLRRLLSLSHVGRAPRGRHRRPRRGELAPGDRALGRHAISEQIQTLI